YFLYHLLGAENVIVVPNGADLMEEMHKVAKEVSEKGNTPYVIPVGGSNPTGAMGYVACAQEIMAQAF
ncbi:pyridoxal-phosphate dependent enzyme, partial [Bacillus cereus]